MPDDNIAGLLTSMCDPSWPVRVDALRAAAALLGTATLGEVGELRLIPALVNATTDAKWEVRKEAAVALGECRHHANVAHQTLATMENDENRCVIQAADRAAKRIRYRASRVGRWGLSANEQDPTLKHIVTRIRMIGLRSMTPAHIYDLCMEITEAGYRDLAADTAHEIRTLLTPFEGYLVQLRRHLASRGADPKAERYLTDAFARLQQIVLLTDSLHEYSAPAESEFAPVDVAALVRDAVAIGCDRGTARGDASMITQVIDLPVGLVIDAIRSRLVRAIGNIVANACQAMRGGGTLTVRARATDGETVAITILDSGPGMTSDQIDDARARFSTTRKDEGGTGLGIPIADRIVKEDHKGDLIIESTPMVGTTVTLILPARRSIDR